MTKTVTVFASAARTSTTNSAALTKQDSANIRGVYLVLDITAASGTSPTLDVTIERFDPVSQQFVAMTGAAFAQKTTTGTSELVIYPGIAETANVSVSDVLSSTWRAVATIAGTTPSFTFSLGGEYL